MLLGTAVMFVADYSEKEAEASVTSQSQQMADI
jgi:hypothetical protein